MTVRLNPYLMFRGNAREAMTFYQQVFGGELNIMPYGQYHSFEDVPGAADLVMHGQLETPDGFVLMGSDLPPGMEAPTGASMSIAVTGDEEERLRGWFDVLAEGGTVGMAMDKQMWGDVYGDLTDRFGVAWSFDVYQG